MLLKFTPKLSIIRFIYNYRSKQYLLEFHILIGKRKVKYQVVAPRLFFLNMEETKRAERTDLEDKARSLACNNEMYYTQQNIASLPLLPN